MVFKWKQNQINLIIDGIMMLVMMVIAGIGLMMKYILVAGYKTEEVYGHHVDLFFAGMDRHEWGTIHLWLSYSLLALLILHIVLHWKLVTGIWLRMIRNKYLRLTLVALFSVLCLFALFGPLFVTPAIHEKTNNSSQHGHFKDQIGIFDSINPQLKHEDSAVHHVQTSVVAGYMTLTEVAKKNNVPLASLLEFLNIPENEADERLGRLKRKYGFEIEDLRKIVETNTETDHGE